MSACSKRSAVRKFADYGKALQAPQQLERLRTRAIIESTESSNRIEGVVAAPGRVAASLLSRWFVSPR